MIQQMKRAGVEFAGCEFNPRDGTFRFFGQPDRSISRTQQPLTREWN